jgi:hypothetical protein
VSHPPDILIESGCEYSLFKFREYFLLTNIYAENALFWGYFSFVIKLPY